MGTRGLSPTADRGGGGVEIGAAAFENVHLLVPPKVKHTAQMGSASCSFVYLSSTDGNRETWENLYELIMLPIVAKQAT